MNTSKKIISLLLCMLMVLSIVPMSVFAVEATKIDTVHIEGIPAPLYGQTVGEYYGAILDERGGGTLTVNDEAFNKSAGKYGNLFDEGLEVKKNDTVLISTSTELITEGNYYVAMTLYPADGYVIPADVAVTVDGAVSVEKDFDEYGSLIVYAKYEVKATKIDEVNLTYDASVIDLNTAWTEREVMYRAASNVAVKTDGVKFSEYAFMAYKNNDGTLKGASSQTEMIDASREYYIQYDLTTKEGYDWIDTAKVSKPTGITVILNGEDVTSDVIFQKYNEYYNSVEMWVPLGDVSTTPIVTELSVAEKTLSLEKGGSHTIQGEVKGTVSDKTIIWTVEGATSTDTTIDNTGKLTIGTDETASILTVKATANADSKKVVNIKVTVLEELPYISTVTVSPETASVYAGGSGKGFYAKVEGTQEDKRVIWTVEGNTSANTVISDSGWLNVGEDETASILTIKATAEKDNTKVGTATVTVLQKTIIKEVNLTYDINAINLNDADTEGVVQQRFINSAATTTEGIEIVKDSVLDSSLMFVLENGVLSEIGDGTNKVNNEREYILKYILDIDYSTHDWEEKIKNDDFSDLKVIVNGEDITANVKKLDYIIGSRELYVYLSIGKPSHAIIPVVKVSATCVNTGKEAYYTCNGCGKNFEDDAATKEITDITMWGIISATGIHTYDNACDTQCNMCNELRAITHTGGTATCKAKAKCTVCGAEYGSLASHKEVTLAAKSATYTSTGLTAGKKCSVCGKTTVAQNTIAKLTLGKVDGLKAKKVKVAKKSEITLTWTSLGDGVKYEVYIKNGKKWTKLTTTSKTSYTVKKDGKKKYLKADKEYQFRVRAVVDDIKGKYSSTLKVETIPSTATLKLKAGKKQLTASWSKVSDISGYEVQYSTSKKFSKKTTKTVKVKKSSKKTTIKKLKKGKKYFVRIRTYKTVDGKKIYSGWSTVKNVKVK